MTRSRFTVLRKRSHGADAGQCERVDFTQPVVAGPNPAGDTEHRLAADRKGNSLPGVRIPVVMADLLSRSQALNDATQ